jgi:integrase
MHSEPLQKPEDPRKTPWNKGKLIGSKPPLRTKDVWSIRTKPQVEKRTRDLAMFNLAIDSKLRGCDVVSLKVEDVAPHGITVDRATVRQRKTRHPVRFELSEQTREAVDDYIRSAPRRVGEFLFPSRRHTERCLTTRQYSRLVDRRNRFRSGPLRHPFASQDKGYSDLSAHRESSRCSSFLLGHRRIESTVRYLGIEVDDALAIAEQVEV